MPHPTLSADDIVRYPLASPDRFEVVLSAERSSSSESVNQFAAMIFTGHEASERLRLQMGGATVNATAQGGAE